MSRKIGFWSVFALVTGSQIGSSVFMSPATLAPYGAYSMAGWLISGVSAICLALVFSFLCSKFPKTGGPHVYAKEAFGPVVGFFTGWTYWVISWVSTTAVIVACIGYLSPLLGNPSSMVLLVLEIMLVLAVTGLNLKGVKAAGSAEFFLSLLEIIPLGVIPIAAYFFFSKANLAVDPAKIADSTTSHIFSSVALLTLWGFIGLESATTPAGSVENPSKTIPRAIILGTTCVAILYFFNSIAIMGVIPSVELSQSRAPYVDAARLMFGGNWYIVISIVASVVCVGTLNAWTLASGQASLGLAEDGLLPAFFAAKNKNDAPKWSLMISCLGIIPILILTADASLASQINLIIDFSVTAFLFVYLISCLAFFKFLWQHEVKHSYGYWFAGAIAAGFSLWVLYETPWEVLLTASLFTLSGLPVFFIMRRRSKKSLNMANQSVETL